MLVDKTAMSCMALKTVGTLVGASWADTHPRGDHKDCRKGSTFRPRAGFCEIFENFVYLFAAAAAPSVIS